MPILVTGFTPFGKVEVNPSQLIVACLAERHPELLTLTLPTAYDAAGEAIRAAIRDVQPSAILMLGVAQSRTVIALERFALNVDDASIPDNAGVLKTGDSIEPSGMLAYTSTLPLKAMLAALQARDIPAAISNHAGTYVCNHVFYVARHNALNIPCGFIHVPGLTEGGMSLDRMVEAIEICLDALTGVLD